MRVYLVRHAIAAPREESLECDDASRALTDKGIERMKQVVRGLRRLDVALDEIWTSPLVRARQTAELLAELPDFSGPVLETDALSPAAPLELIGRQLAGLDTARRVALVGHEPDLGILATAWISGAARRDVTAVGFKKGGVACFDLDPRPGGLIAELCWMMAPKHLRGIGS